MKITPIDIAHKQFAKKMMGFSPEEVQEFLQSVAEEMENLSRERNQLKETLREKELQIHEYRERDKALRDTIATAQKMSEKITQETQRESKLIINDANQQAEMIVKDARDSLKRIYQEISDLKKIRIQFDTNMKALLNAHLGLLENQDNYMPKPQINKPSEPLSTQVSPIRSTEII